jgi:hypothetical protein
MLIRLLFQIVAVTVTTLFWRVVVMLHCNGSHNLPLDRSWATWIKIASSENISYDTIWYMIWCDMTIWYMTSYDMISYDMIYVYLYTFNRNWVDDRWQQYSTHLHTNNTQNTENRTYITIKKLTNFGIAGRAQSLRVIPWNLPYNWGKSMEKPQLGFYPQHSKRSLLKRIFHQNSVCSSCFLYIYISPNHPNVVI